MGKRFLILAAICLVITVSILGQKKTEPQLFSVNLIKNGGAETGESRDWTNSTELKTFRYDGGWGDAWQVTPTSHGDSYFHASVSKAIPKLEFSQNFDLSKIAAEIDANKVDYYLSGWFGVRDFSGARLKTAFYGIDGKQIQEDSTEKFSSENRPDDVTFVQKSRGGIVPAGTRKVKVTLEFYIFENADKEEGLAAFADNLSLVLTEKEK
ncbi:MAG: hypothetical protein K1X72_03755 [Pyrinomonadaceae bacterium]|nr:hypothetical protein [Pyrinomonadaceae bacterium]